MSSEILVKYEHRICPLETLFVFVFKEKLARK